MKKIVLLAMFSAILYSGCSDNCNGAPGYCKNDYEYNVCMEEIDNNWDTRSCDSMFSNPEGGTACATFDGKSDCVRKCALGKTPAVCDQNILTSCREKKYQDGTVGGVLWEEYCPYGCSVDNNGIVVSCIKEKPAE